MTQPAKITTITPAAFSIETDIPPPRGPRQGVEHQAIAALAAAPIGASFFLVVAKAYTIQQAAWRLGGKGWVTTRRVDDGFRVWKIAEPKTRA